MPRMQHANLTIESAPDTDKQKKARNALHVAGFFFESAELTADLRYQTDS
jgi:hypothetical protein